MKKILSILFALVLVATLSLVTAVAPVAAAPDVTVSIDAPDTAETGSTFTANVNITTVTNFDACNYDVSFDASVLELTSVTSGLIDSTTIPVSALNEISSGTWRVVQNVEGFAGVSGSGYLAVLNFQVTGAEGTSSTITLSSGMLGDNTTTEIPGIWVGDSVSVPDATAPTVSSVLPVADATDVAIDTTVSVTFNEAMNESTITTSSFTLAGVSGSVSYNSGTYTATFTPSISLAYSTTYTTTLSTAITDVTGNPLASAYSWSFTTTSAPPTEGVVTVTAETLTSPVVATNAATDVAIYSATLTGDLTDMGTATPVDVSFEYGTTSGSYSYETTATSMSTTGLFSAGLTGLTHNETYYFRAKAVVDSTIYGDELSFTTTAERIGISVSPTLIDFGRILAGESSDTRMVIVTNTGNIVEDFAAILDNEDPPGFYIANLAINNGSVSDWSATNVAVNSTATPGLVLSMPLAAPAGSKTATIIFLAGKS